MEWDRFEIGFWHPFGRHGGESPEEILDRKGREIAANGWTLWSFQFRETLEAWYREIQKEAPKSVFAFCSDGKGDDPKGEVRYCDRYRFVGREEWRSIPQGVEVPHPVGSKGRGSAFVVKNLGLRSGESETFPAVEWFRKDGRWIGDEALPSRGEFLIRQGSGVAIRPFRAVLELKEPYLAEIGAAG